MASQAPVSLSVTLLLLLSPLALAVRHTPIERPRSLAGGQCDKFAGGPQRSDFPADFFFGVATSAYQVEGAAALGGKGPSIWDEFVKQPGKIADSSTGVIADDEFHKMDEDVALIKNLGMNSYRFSIAWSRVLPAGAGEVNLKGIAYYNALIDALLKAGITPAVTLYHWDMPEALQEKYGGWLGAQSIVDFATYADLCFKNFGDRVKTWITMNEPQEVTVQGFGMGWMAPGRCSNRDVCPQGNSSTEPYLAAHNIIQAHAAAVNLYRSTYQKDQGGKIGITLDCTWMYPADATSAADKAAAQQALEFQFSWFFHPIYFGKYPDSMTSVLGERLPAFSADAAAAVKGSYDFLGLNFYTAQFASPAAAPIWGLDNPFSARLVKASAFDANDKPVGADTASGWLKVTPEAIYHMTLWIKEMYPGVPIIITENGVSQKGDDPNVLQDTQRVNYYKDYLIWLAKAIGDGAPVQGYYAWSLLDNFEWGAGYSQRFGIYYVDFSDPKLTRVPKDSASWWSCFLQPATV